MIVSLAGIGGHYPPSDEAEFTAKLAQLRSPIIAEEVALGGADVAGLLVSADGESLAAL